jgi:hypothetical protein
MLLIKAISEPGDVMPPCIIFAGLENQSDGQDVKALLMIT